MFLLNSRQGHFTATPSGSTLLLHPTGAPLLPKLRSYFAEFLNEGSLVRLGILYPSTSVGLRYGRAGLNLEAFLGSMGSSSLAALWAPPSPLRIRQRICLSPSSPYRLGTEIHRPAGLPFCVPPSLTTPRGTGILTCCPSPTPFGLGLGPTNPTRINLPSETLDLRRTCFSHVLRYSCRHSHFCRAPPVLTVRLLRRQNAPLPLTDIQRYL